MIYIINASLRTANHKKAISIIHDWKKTIKKDYKPVTSSQYGENHQQEIGPKTFVPLVSYSGFLSDSQRTVKKIFSVDLIPIPLESYTFLYQ